MKVLLIILALIIPFFIFSCGDITEDADKTLSHINISPTSATLAVGETQSFSATAVYTDQTTASPSFSWTVTGDIGTIEEVGLNALFTATASGSGTVVAVYSDKTGVATVTVTGATEEVTAEAGVLYTIEISPSTKTLRVGASETFTAAGKDIDGSSVEISPAWEISGEAIGVFSSFETTATLEANAEGAATIICSSGEVTGHAYVTVEGFVVEITAEVDTYVDSSDGSAHGTDTTLIAGRITDPSEKRYEAYISFEVSFIPAGSTIDSATLKLYATSTDGTAMNIGRLSSSWSESTTWESKPTIGSFIKNHTFTAGANEIGIKDTVQYWLDTSNHGVAIYKDPLATGYVNLISEEDTSVEERRPKLRVEYTAP